MKKCIALLAGGIVAAALVGCGAKTVSPSYTSTNPDLLRIGGDKPENLGAQVQNLGSYCLQVRDEWKGEGKTQDDQTIWTKDSYRTVVPCR